MEEEVSPQEMRQCLEAISRHPKGAPESELPLAEIYSHASPGGRYVHINFVKPSDVPVGATYRTWVVQLGMGEPPRVSYFLSRRGAAGDDTLPPDD